MDLAEFNAAKKEIAARREAVTNELETVFKTAVMELFDKHAGYLHSISWVQYTPYFNDGDTCHFNAHLPPTVNGFGDYEDEDAQEAVLTAEEIAARNEWQGTATERWMPQWYGVSEERRTQFEAAEKAVHELFEQFDSDDFETMFGDHAKITITQEGIDVDSYEHD
jgi:hypothetical protein